MSVLGRLKLCLKRIDRCGFSCELIQLDTLASAAHKRRHAKMCGQIHCLYLPGYLPGVATSVLLKYLCSHRISRTSVLEETHPRLFQSLQTILERVHSTCIHYAMIQTVPSVD